jgi:hypothetical protein
MADPNSVDLKSFFESLPPKSRGAFKPTAHYGEEEDALIFYFRDDPDYAKRINKRVTIYLSLDSDQLVGCEIKGVRHVLEDLGSFDVAINHKDATLQMLFMAYLGTLDSPDDRKVFRGLAKEAIKSKLKIPQLA